MIDGCPFCRLKLDRKAHQPTMTMCKKISYVQWYWTSNKCSTCNKSGIFKDFTTSDHDIIVKEEKDDVYLIEDNV